MHGRSSADGAFHPYHVSLRSYRKAFDTKRERSTHRETLKKNAALERNSDVARSGAAVGDRIQHRLPPKTSELSLFRPPVPQQDLCEEDRVQLHSGEWESFPSPCPSFTSARACGSLASVSRSCSSSCSSPRSQLGPARDAIPQEHSGSTFISEHAMQESAQDALERTLFRAMVGLHPEPRKASELHWGEELSDARRRAAEEQKCTSISALLNEAKAHKHAADEETTLLASSMKFLESAACFLLASDFMSSVRSQHNACKRILEETLVLLESVFKRGLHRAPPTGSRSCRLAILFLKMRAFLNQRIGLFCSVDEPTTTFSRETLKELAGILLNGESRNPHSSGESASLAEIQSRSPTSGTDLLDTYRCRLNRMNLATNFWIRADALAEISENKVFFDAVESGSAVSSVNMPTKAFVLYVREAIYRINVLGDSV